MRVRTLVAVLLAAGSSLPAEERTGTGTGTSTSTSTGVAVTYRSDTSIYVSGGRAAGLAVGDRLALVSGAETVAELEVVFLAEHSASCKVIRETRPLKAGERLVRLGAPRPAAAPASPQREIAVAPSDAPAPPYVGSARRDLGRTTRVMGGASLGYGTFQDRSGSGRDIQEQSARADFAARDLGGMPLDARVRGSSRQIERAGLRSERNATDSRQRLYEASLSWAPPEGRFSAAAGRLGAYPFVSLGYLDGALAQARVTSAVRLGAYAGRTPDALDVGLPTGLKYGAFVRFGGQSAASPGEIVFSGGREFAGSEVSREYVGQQAQLRSGDLWLFERVEVDLNRGWRRDRAGTGAEISEAGAQLTWRASPQVDLSLSYDRSRNYWSALTRILTSEVFDRRLRQTVRAEARVSRAGGAGFWLGGSARSEEGIQDPSFAAYAGLRSPRFLSLNVALEGSYYETPATRGLLASVRGGRGLRGGHRLDVSYTAQRYEAGGAGWRMSQWLRGSGYAQLPGGVFSRADVEYALQDDLPGLRVLIEIGYRF
jgi:hypothetical protein